MFICSRNFVLSFDSVAKNGNNVEATFDFVERIVRLVAFDNVASTLLLMWMGVYDDRRVLVKKEEKFAMFRV